MSHKAAPEEKLGELHEIVAETLIAQLSEDEIDPRVLSAAISFLRDNKIKANPFLDEQINEIQEKLRHRRKRFEVVDGKEAAERAAANM